MDAESTFALLKLALALSLKKYSQNKGVVAKQISYQNLSTGNYF